MTNSDTGDGRKRALIEWLDDRNSFHTWFSSVIVGSFVVLTAFGNQPDINTFAGRLLIIAMVALLFAIVCNMICVWSIPAWKLKLRTEENPNTAKMHRDLAITTSNTVEITS